MKELIFIFLLSPAYAEVSCGNSKWYTGVPYRFPVEELYFARDRRLSAQYLSPQDARENRRHYRLKGKRRTAQCLFA